MAGSSDHSLRAFAFLVAVAVVGGVIAFLITSPLQGDDDGRGGGPTSVDGSIGEPTTSEPVPSTTSTTTSTTVPSTTSTSTSTTVPVIGTTTPSAATVAARTAVSDSAFVPGDYCWVSETSYRDVLTRVPHCLMEIDPAGSRGIVSTDDPSAELKIDLNVPLNATHIGGCVVFGDPTGPKSTIGVLSVVLDGVVPGENYFFSVDEPLILDLNVGETSSVSFTFSIDPASQSDLKFADHVLLNITYGTTEGGQEGGGTNTCEPVPVTQN